METLNWGMISYEVPLETYPDTTNKKPLQFAGLAAQKRHRALYLSCAYSDGTVARKIVDRFKQSGKRLDMGKSCIRYKLPEDLDLEVIGEVIRENDLERFISTYEQGQHR